MSPIPVVVIGARVQVANAVRKGLEPEYDVVHILTDVSKALNDLPLLLSTPPKIPDDTGNNPGSQNYGARPRIVAIGGGHSEENFTEMKDACKDVDNGIVWLKKDLSKATQKPDFSNLEAYGMLTAGQMKETLGAMNLDDKEVDGVYYFS